MRIEHEHERNSTKDEVEGLKMQLRNIVDASRVIGELLV
jgi:hypothetical protein